MSRPSFSRTRTAPAVTMSLLSAAALDTAKSDSSFCWMPAGVLAVWAMSAKEESRRAMARERGALKRSGIMASFSAANLYKARPKCTGNAEKHSTVECALQRILEGLSEILRWFTQLQIQTDGISHEKVSVLFWCGVTIQPESAEVTIGRCYLGKLLIQPV